MNDKLEIFFSKVFGRMRHKTQLFSGAADDHYHTRLQHTIEVEEIALRMAKKLLAKYPDIVCNLSKLSSIALLHDIGHTPFGHAGERALHELVSGKCSKEYGLPDFKELGVAIGFKHNINSGLLYVENTIFDDINYDVLDGIVRHTKIFYKNERDLDYGFKYVFHNHEEYYNNDGPKTLEGFIVSYADEIAQICSDYLDIGLDAQSNNERTKFDCEPYHSLKVFSSEKRINAKEACDSLIDSFVESFTKNDDFKDFKNNKFTNIINDFDKYRRYIIDSNERINKHDEESKNIIKKLYSYYLNNPLELTQDFFDDFAYRVRKIKYSRPHIYYTYIDNLTNDKETVLKLIKASEEYILNNSKSPNNRILKDYQSIYKMYIRSLAIHISKMTDDYALHKYQKLVDISY